MDAQTYIVYVNGDSGIMKGWSGNVIEKLWVFPNDRVVCINPTEGKLTIELGDKNTVFVEEKIDIEPRRREMLTVQDEARGETDCTIKPYESTLSDKRPPPKVVVGDED